MAGLSYKKYLGTSLEDKGPYDYGPSPYTQDGYRRATIDMLDDRYDPIGSKTFAANQDAFNIALKNQELGLPEYEGSVLSKVWGKLSDLGKWGVSTPVGRGALWIADMMDRPFNAIEGAFEETRDQSDAAGRRLSPGEELRAIGKGFMAGLKQEKDYNIGRYLEKVGSDSEVWQDIMRARPLRLGKALLDPTDNFEHLSTDEMRGRSGPQDDPEYAGLMNSTIADMLGLGLNFKTALFPVKLGRIKVPGAPILDDVAKPQTFKFARSSQPLNSVDKMFDTLTDAGRVEALRTYNVGRRTGYRMYDKADNILFDSLDPKNLRNTLTRGATGTRPKSIRQMFHVEPPAPKVGDPSLRRVLQLDVLGQTFTPFKGAQLKAGVVLGDAGRKALSLSPGLERFLSHFTNRIESSATKGASKAFDVIDDGRQGSRVAVANQHDRMRQALDAYLGKGYNLTPNENRVLYYATTLGKDLADPQFLQEMNKAFNIPMDELRQMTKLEPMRQWWLGEAAEYAKRGEARGLFRAVETDYMPIFSKSDPKVSPLVDDMDKFGQEFSGLRSFQKHRNREFMPNLIQRGAKGDLALDSFTDAIDRYSRSFANLERRRNVLKGLEDLGLVSQKAKDGFKPLADVLAVDSMGRGLAKPYYINEKYINRFRDEIFGYGGGGGLYDFLKFLSKIQNPWKSFVTAFNPKYHTGNLKDDFARNFLLGETNADDLAAAVSRETSGPYVRGVEVPDWTKREVQGLTQWEYTPGSRMKYDLTAREASELGRSMGVNVVQTTDEIARSRSKNAFARGFNKTVNAMEWPQGVFREANFLGGLRTQGNARLARDIVSQDLINYRDITPFLRDVVRPFVPFITFRAKNPVVALNQLAMNPTWFGRLGMAQKYAQRDDDNLQLPEYYRDKPIVAWKDKSGNLQILDTGLSQFDSHFLLPGQRTGDLLRRLPGPLLQLPMGLISGKDSLGRPIDGPQESNWIDALLVGQKGMDGKTYSPGKIKFIFDTLFGELADYNVNEPLMPQFDEKLGQIKTFNGLRNALNLQLEKNRLQNERLGLLQDTGTYIPPKSAIMQRRSQFR